MSDQQPPAPSHQKPGPVTGDPADVLRTLPPVAALALRDLIRGLEAEAGSARALLARSERLRHTEAHQLKLMIHQLRGELGTARAAVGAQIAHRPLYRRGLSRAARIVRRLAG